MYLNGRRVCINARQLMNTVLGEDISYLDQTRMQLPFMSAGQYQVLHPQTNICLHGGVGYVCNAHSMLANWGQLWSCMVNR